MLSRSSTLSRFMLAGFAIACVAGMVGVFALRSYQETTSEDFRRHFVSLLIRSIESDPEFNPAPMGNRPGGMNLWLLSEKGKVLRTNSGVEPPVSWNDLKKPVGVHELSFHYGWFKVSPDLILIRLERNAPFLLIEPRRPGHMGRELIAQIALLLLILVTAVLVAMILVFIYLKRKSAEARSILSRL